LSHTMHRNSAQNRENRIESRFAGESIGFPGWCNHIASRSTSPCSAAWRYLSCQFRALMSFSYLDQADSTIPRAAGRREQSFPLSLRERIYRLTRFSCSWVRSGVRMSKRASGPVSRRLFLTFSACRWPACANFPQPRGQA